MILPLPVEVDATPPAVVPPPAPIVQRVAARAMSREAGPPSPWARLLKGLSMPVMVRRIVEAHPSGISAKDVVEIIRVVSPKVDPALVHSGLYRGLEGDTLRSEGSRGSRLYFPVVPSAATEQVNVPGVEPKEDTM